MTAAAAATSDFGGLVSRMPQRRWRPGSSAEVAEIVREAARHRRRVVVRGTGHTTNGQSQTGEWLLETGRLDRVADPDGDSVWVGAGATWREVLRRCEQAGKCPPVLTGHLGLSVGGTLSVGGFGPASATRGLQVDHVLALEVVTGTGRIVTCSPGDHRALFDACRGGFGQFGVMTAARLRLEELPRLMAGQDTPCGDAQALMAQLRAFAYSCAEVHGEMTVTRAGPRDAWSFEATGVRRVYDSPGDVDGTTAATWTTDHWQYATRLDGKDWDASKRWRHPWIDVVLPSDRAVEYLEAVQRTVSPATLGEHGFVLVLLAKAGAGRGCFAPLSASTDHVLIDVLRKLPAADPGVLVRALRENRELLDRAHRMGGVLYGISAVDASPEEWVRAAKDPAVLGREQHPDAPGVFLSLSERVMVT